MKKLLQISGFFYGTDRASCSNLLVRVHQAVLIVEPWILCYSVVIFCINILFNENNNSSNNVLLNDLLTSSLKFCFLSLRALALFSVMCYNVLCDKYATRQLYGYCPSWALNWEYRKKSIMQEILNCSADIISLQVCHPLAWITRAGELCLKAFFLSLLQSLLKSSLFHWHQHRLITPNPSSIQSQVIWQKNIGCVKCHTFLKNNIKMFF